MKHSALEKAQALKVALGAVGALAKSYSLRFNVDSNVGSSDLWISNDALMAEIHPGIQGSGGALRETRYSIVTANINRLPDIILSGPAYRQAWIQGSDDVDVSIVTACTALFVGILKNLLIQVDDAVNKTDEVQVQDCIPDVERLIDDAVNYAIDRLLQVPSTLMLNGNDYDKYCALKGYGSNKESIDKVCRLVNSHFIEIVAGLVPRGQYRFLGAEKQSGSKPKLKKKSKRKPSA